MVKTKKLKTSLDTLKKPQWEKRFSSFDGKPEDGMFKEDHDDIKLNTYYLAKVVHYNLQIMLHELKFVAQPWNNYYMSFCKEGNKEETTCLVAIDRDRSTRYINTFNTIHIIVKYTHCDDFYDLLTRLIK